MRNRRTSIVFKVFSGYRVGVIESRDMNATGRRLRVKLKGCAAAYVKGDGSGTIVFGLSPDEATVAHEASHAVRAMFAHVGARNDDEVFAYHLDYLVGRIHRFLKGR